MTKAVFAGKEIKEFFLQQRFTFLGFTFTIFPGFPENFFMRYSPGNAGYRQSHYKKINDLILQTYYHVRSINNNKAIF